MLFWSLATLSSVPRTGPLERAPCAFAVPYGCFQMQRPSATADKWRELIAVNLSSLNFVRPIRVLSIKAMSTGSGGAATSGSGALPSEESELSRTFTTTVHETYLYY